MIAVKLADCIPVRAYTFFLHNIAPFSIIYCIALAVYPILPPVSQVYRIHILVECWLLAEALFYGLFYLPYRRHLRQSAVHPVPLSRPEREELYRRCNATVTDPENYLRQWFRGAKSEDIKRENVEEFVVWAFFNNMVTDEDGEEIESYLQEMETLLGRKLEPGRGSAKSLRLTLDDVGCSHRSLLWYWCIFVVDSITSCRMLYNGFHLHRTAASNFFTVFPFRPLALFSPYKSPVNRLTYWHREHKSKTRLPVLFIHGIGVGLYPYTEFLRDLNKATGTNGEEDVDFGVIALEIMPVSTRITKPALDKDDMVEQIHSIVKHHGWDKFVLVSHSYGSVIATHLIKSPLTGPRVGPVVYADPITFLLHLPDVAFNFTARLPSSAKELVLWYFGSKDIGVAHTLARRFFWSENIIWKEDFGAERDLAVVLSGKDLIVNTKAVRRYLTTPASEAPGAVWKTYNDPSVPCTTIVKEAAAGPTKGAKFEVLWFEEVYHGQVFDHEETRGPVIEAIREYSARA
ncbi:hypothetical protein MBLNU459_g6831t1 [Dothideomycetes sp. NU459]